MQAAAGYVELGNDENATRWWVVVLGDDHRITHLVAKGFNLALCQLFAIVQLFNPLVEFLEGRLLLHSRVLRNDFERVFEAGGTRGAQVPVSMTAF